jgi:hypothetical protein
MRKLDTHYYLGCWRRHYTTHIETAPERVTCKVCLKYIIRSLPPCPDLDRPFPIPRKIG